MNKRRPRKNKRHPDRGKPHKPETLAISVRIGTDKVERLERLAEATDRPRSWHIEQALDAYLDAQAWQIGQIETAIAEMDAGRSVPHDEVADWLRAWGKGNKRKPPPG
jgi:predicted transcriptional regulator